MGRISLRRGRGFCNRRRGEVNGSFALGGGHSLSCVGWHVYATSLTLLSATTWPLALVAFFALRWIFQGEDVPTRPGFNIFPAAEGFVGMVWQVRWRPFF